MNQAREAVYAAIYNKLLQVQGFTTISRKWSPQGIETDRQKLPALYMRQARETPVYTGHFVPVKWELTVYLIIYAAAGDQPDKSAMPVVNPLVDAVEAAFVVSEQLGGLVHSCHWSGISEIYEGVSSNVSAVAMELKLVVP